MPKTPAERLADELLQKTPIAELLTTAYAITHRMHVATDLTVSADLRAQRDLITAEITRRTDRQGA